MRRPGRLFQSKSLAFDGGRLQLLAVDQGALGHERGNLDVAGLGVKRIDERIDQTGRPEAFLTSHN